jgi:uncharacterized protein (DUF58 family)
MIPKEVLKKVKLIEIQTRSLVNSVVAGAYSSAFQGKGMEFSEVREYLPGDDVRDIDWNVTAKTGSPYTKRFTEERERTVMLAVDASASGDFGSQGEMKGEVMANISALLAFSAIQNKDRVGLLIFTSKVEKYIPPKKGKKHVLRVIRELLYFKPQETGTDLNLALSHLNKILNRRSIVFLISDFKTADFEKSIKLLNQHHDVSAITVLDPREKSLPNVGFLELEDAETGEVLLVDTGDSHFRSMYEQESTTQISTLQKLFTRLRIDHVEIETLSTLDETFVPLVRFFHKKASHTRR